MNHQKTIELLRPSLENDPTNWELRLHLAELYQENGSPDQAADLILDGGPHPEEETLQLKLATILSQVKPAQALPLLDTIISNNKACAEAYLLKAHIYRKQGMEKEARKHYHVAAVIDEKLEDPDFEAWLDSTSPTPENRVPIAQTTLDHPHSSQPLDAPAQIEKDHFIETDPEVDEFLAMQDRLIDFSHVGGMEDLKERIRMSIIYPLKNKDLFKKFKKRTGGGLLLYGPPGCGKTLISRATAGECGAHFISVSIHEILSKWIGESEQRMHEIFAVARRKSPTIIFIDEIDALGVKRSSAGNSASLVNTLLTEIDGAGSDNQDILILGATNTPWRIDSAFRRPGRFDHSLFIPPPDLPAREAILKLMLADIPQSKVDTAKLAKMTDRFSGADLRSIVEKASEKIIHQIMKTGKEATLSQKDLVEVIKATSPTTLEWLEQASNYASYANQAGLYDELAEYLKP